MAASVTRQSRKKDAVRAPAMIAGSWIVAPNSVM